MRLNLLKIVLLSSFAFVACGTKTKIPDEKLCSSIGSYGAICQYSFSERRERMNIDQFIDFLSAKIDNPATKEVESKGAALCMASESYMRYKTALEQLCVRAGAFCTYEDKKLISEVSKRVETLQKQVKVEALK